jgi:hypothetical protein
MGKAYSGHDGPKSEGNSGVPSDEDDGEILEHLERSEEGNGVETTTRVIDAPRLHSITDGFLDFWVALDGLANVESFGKAEEDEKPYGS